MAQRFSLPIERVGGALRALASDEGGARVVLGEFRPDGVTREWCDVDVLRRLRRRSLAALRREVEPVEPSALARFLPAWHGIPGQRGGIDALVEALGLLSGASLVASSIESDVLPARVAEYRGSLLDELCTTGDVVWVGAGAIGSSDGRVRLCFADQLAHLAPTWERPDPPGGPLHDAIREHLGQRGASFWTSLREVDSSATDIELLAALWDLVWAGEVTNDSFSPLRAVLGGASASRAARRSPARGRPRLGRLTRIGPPAGAGRWSLVAPLLEPAPSATESAHAAALQLAERYGVVTREAVLAEGQVGGFSGVYGILKILEERGQVRRGYFVAGLGAAQFALPGAVDRLRASDQAERVLILAATDPAQPYGASLAWPESPGRPARAAGGLVVLKGGEPLVWYDRRSHHLVTFPAMSDHPEWAPALAGLVADGRTRQVEIRKVNGDSTIPDGIATAAREAGFVDSYRGLVYRR